MKNYPKDNEKQQVGASEPEVGYLNREAVELERLKKHVYMSDMEKLQAFTRMLIRNATLKKAVVTHQK